MLCTNAMFCVRFFYVLQSRVIQLNVNKSIWFPLDGIKYENVMKKKESVFLSDLVVLISQWKPIQIITAKRTMKPLNKKQKKVEIVYTNGKCWVCRILKSIEQQIWVLKGLIMMYWKTLVKSTESIMIIMYRLEISYIDIIHFHSSGIDDMSWRAAAFN